jgi:hypothetical protein
MSKIKHTIESLQQKESQMSAELTRVKEEI